MAQSSALRRPADRGTGTHRAEWVHGVLRIVFRERGRRHGHAPDARRAPAADLGHRSAGTIHARGQPAGSPLGRSHERTSPDTYLGAPAGPVQPDAAAPPVDRLLEAGFY